MSLIDGSPWIWPRAARAGAEARNRRATRWMSSGVMFSKKKIKSTFSFYAEFLFLPIELIKCWVFFLCPVASTCLPISSKTTGLDSKFIRSIDWSCVFARLSSWPVGAEAIATSSFVITSTIDRTWVGGALAWMQNNPVSMYAWLYAVALYIQWYLLSTLV